MKKRTLGLIMALLLVVNLLAIPAYAVPGKGNAAKFKVEFSDINEASWAQEAVSKMNKKGVIHGYGNGLFKPNKPITELEAIIMVLRLAGLEDEADEAKLDILSGKKNYKVKWDDWAMGYIDVAIDAEIMDESDGRNLNASAKRYVIAKYVVRAFGLEDDAQDSMDETLPFKDFDHIPDAYKGYVVVAYNEGWINGFPNGMFQPFKPATRAEMAVILSNADGDFTQNDYQYTRYDTFSGVIENVDSNDIEIDTDDGDMTFDFDNDVEVNFEDDEGKVSDLKEGDEVKVWVNDDDEVVRVDVERDLYTTYEGVIENVDNDEIEVDTDDGDMTFDFDNDVEVNFEDEEGDIEDLEVGDEVKVWVNGDDEVTRVDVEDDLFTTYEGEIDLVDDEEIRLEVSGPDITFDFADDVEVMFDDEEGEVNDLKVGFDVTVKVNRDDEAVKVTLEIDLFEEVSGVVETIDTDTIKLEDNSKTYDIDSDVVVTFDDEDDADVTDVKEGDEVTLIVRSEDLVTEIDVDGDLNQ